MKEVSKRIKEAVMESKMTWEPVDYLGATRYISLSWSSEECQASKMRKYLPRRRGRTGTRPRIKGDGQEGRSRGDQEQ